MGTGGWAQPGTEAGPRWEDDGSRILPHLLSSASSLPGPAPTLLLAQVTSAKGGENNERFDGICRSRQTATLAWCGREGRPCPAGSRTKGESKGVCQRARRPPSRPRQGRTGPTLRAEASRHLWGAGRRAVRGHRGPIQLAGWVALPHILGVVSSDSWWWQKPGPPCVAVT